MFPIDETPIDETPIDYSADVFAVVSDAADYEADDILTTDLIERMESELLANA